ncbi:MAG: methionyl-tRNA formyltransferase [Chitinispirillia bacterium]|jgi:methionyl-tRNA formyltransferase
MKIVFLGTADFGIPSLEGLIKHNYTISGIVTTPPTRKGRGLKYIESPIAEFATHNNIKPVFKPADLKDEHFKRDLCKLNADLFVVVAFRILPPEIFNIPSIGTINIHASLLPKYRGPAPIQRAIEAGERETGITIFQIEQGIDTGNILLQRSISINRFETAPDIYSKLSKLGSDALIEVCTLSKKGKIIGKKQDLSKISKAPKLLKSESGIDWNNTSEAIFNKIKAFKPFPGTYTLIYDKRVNIEWAIPITSSDTFKPGTVVNVGIEYFDIQCGKGCLRILEVKPEGKKRMSSRAFMNGTKILKDMIIK